MAYKSKRFYGPSASSTDQFLVSVRLVENTLVVTLSGELDMATGPMLLEHLQPFEYRATSVVYDLSGLTFMDAGGLRCLLSPFANDIGGVTVFNPTRAVRRVFEILHLESLITEPEPTLTLGPENQIAGVEG